MNDARVLIVEDDERVGELIAGYLARNGFRVELLREGTKAVSRIRETQPDVVVLDVMLPGEDGLSICRRIRPHYDGSILMLTARGEELDHVLGLELGADDYLVKPASMRILLARIRALLRRSGAPSPSSIIELGALVVDRGRREARLDAQPMDLSTAEFDLLWDLASHAGTPRTRQELMQALRGIDYDGLDRTMDVRILKLRQKLGDDPKQPTWIHTVRGVGYQLKWSGH